MSGERLLDNRNVDTSNSLILETKKTTRQTRNRVDINVLLSKVRQEKKKQNKENIVFFSLISSIIIITGIIASL
tara:strand:- start:1017 stop:1238 length:222 start_codon:yes stop_codon:yes gene_type:complete